MSSINFSRFSDLTHFGLVKLVKGRFVLTPKGVQALKQKPANLAPVQALLDRKNTELHAHAVELRRIMAKAKVSRKKPESTGWIKKKPTPKPKHPRK